MQALKTGTTVENTFEYYWPDNLSELIWKEAHLMADLSRGMLCPKCGKTGFLTQPPILQTELNPIHIIGQTLKLNKVSVRTAP